MIRPVRSSRRTARQLAERELRELVRAYEAGATVYQLATRFGIHRDTVAKHLHQQGVAMRFIGMSNEQVAEAVRLYRDGWTLLRLSERFRFDRETIRRAIIKTGVRMRKGMGAALGGLVVIRLFVGFCLVACHLHSLHDDGA